MARKPANPSRKPSHQPPRQTPYALPYRVTSVFSTADEATSRLWVRSAEPHQDTLRSQTISPGTSYSNSNGPPTPESTTRISPQASPYLTTSIEDQHYRLPYSEDALCTDDATGYAYLEQDRTSDLFDESPPTFSPWSDQSQTLSICEFYPLVTATHALELTAAIWGRTYERTKD
jgi:hypothetical protein